MEAVYVADTALFAAAADDYERIST
jgi:hypothetical protein